MSPALCPCGLVPGAAWDSYQGSQQSAVQQMASYCLGGGAMQLCWCKYGSDVSTTSSRRLAAACSCVIVHYSTTQPAPLILQAPHEVLGALAVLGCTSPASASHGPGCIPRLVAGCRDKLMDPLNGGAAPIAASWALAVMQVGLDCCFKPAAGCWQAPCFVLQHKASTRVGHETYR